MRLARAAEIVALASMPNVSYAVFTCFKHADLVTASLETCLRDQPVRLLNDIDDRDVTLQMHSLGIKLLRWLKEPFDTPWTMLVDDDTWVNASVVDRVCVQLDPNVPAISGYGCIRTDLDKGGYGDIFGEAALVKAQQWWDKVSRTSGFTSFWHGGAGTLLSRAVVDEMRTTAFDGNSKLSESCIHALERSGTPVQQVLSAIPQDKLLSVLISATKKRVKIRQRSLRGSLLFAKGGRLKRDPPLNAWEQPGNGIGRTDKMVADLNCSFPKKGGEFSAALAVSLVEANTSPRVKETDQHVIRGQANLMTWHRFKRPEMFYEMESAKQSQSTDATAHVASHPVLQQPTVQPRNGPVAPVVTTKRSTTPDDLMESYFEYFTRQVPSILADYIQKGTWTPWATRALVEVGRGAFPGAEAAAKWHSGHNQFNRSEYLNLDVTIFDAKTWGSPVFIAEHENHPSKEQIQYDAWKLLSVEAECRMLVGYWGPGTDFATFEILRLAIAEVCLDHPHKQILLIAGRNDARPSTSVEFRRAHDIAIVTSLTVP